MIPSLIIGLVGTTFGGLLGYFISTAASRKVIDLVVKEEVKHHEEVYHQEEMRKYVKEAIVGHESNCSANQDFQTIKQALAVLVHKAGEDPVKLGLI